MKTSAIITPSAGLFHDPSTASGRETDGLFGEEVTILNNVTNDAGEDWAEIILRTDGYQAWIKKECVGMMPKPSHHVIAPRALMTAADDIKSPAAGYIPMGGLITTSPAPDNERMVGVMGPDDAVMGYIMADHILPMGHYCDDFVTVAEGLVGTPYRWGGRDSFGFDCSALVQLSLAAAGYAVPRNSGDQERHIGTTLSHIDDLRRGDLVFWKGHVGIMQDDARLLHANMWHGMTASEDLRAALPRLEKATGPITRMARP